MLQFTLPEEFKADPEQAGLTSSFYVGEEARQQVWAVTLVSPSSTPERLVRAVLTGAVEIPAGVAVQLSLMGVQTPHRRMTSGPLALASLVPLTDSDG